MKRKAFICVLMASLCISASVSLAEETEKDVTAEVNMEMKEDAKEEDTETDTLAVEGEAEPEDNPYFMEPEGSYQIDLDGNGTLDMIRYETLTEESEENGFKGILKIYKDGNLLYTLEGRGGTYGWSVCHCPMPDGKNYLLAYSRSDNDWTDQAFLLSQEDEDSLTIVGELCELSRREEENSENFLSGWARLSWVPVEEIGKDSITISWIDTAYSAGILYPLVEYRITEDGLKACEPPYALMEADKDWTASQELVLVKEPGSEKTAFEIKEGDTVKLTAITSLDNVFYLKCVMENGESGWLKDADGIEYHEEDETYGYFEEAFFAG